MIYIRELTDSKSDQRSNLQQIYAKYQKYYARITIYLPINLTFNQENWELHGYKLIMYRIRFEKEGDFLGFHFKKKLLLKIIDT